MNLIATKNLFEYRTLIANKWEDYELIDTGDSMKLERWGKIILSRPDPQVIWKPSSPKEWKFADAKYIRSSKGGGEWSYNTKIPDKWTISYGNLKFYIEPTGFKHTGLFPEQASNWDWMSELIKNRVKQGESVKVLNLFGYTGGATVACAAAGASVCHVDASKGMVARAKENVLLSGLNKAEVRYIVDDAFKFVTREIKRGNLYDAIIMDPPSYGRGPNGEVWKLEDNLYDFVSECVNLLSKNSLFFLLNSYTTGLSSIVTGNILEMLIRQKKSGKVTCGDLCLPMTTSETMLLPCGSFARWEDMEY